MAPNEASRLRSQPAEPRTEEGSAARPLVREPSTEVPSGEALAALERAAENLRPSWHGAELPSEPEQGTSHASLPAPLPPPPALPMFSSFPIEQPAPHYSVDTTVRTAAVLPERLAQLLRQPQIARARNRALRQIADASRWLRARPWALGSLAIVAVPLLASLFWPSAPEGAPLISASPKPASGAPAVPAAHVPAASAAQEPPAAARSETDAKQPDPEPPAASAKKRDKRKAAAAKQGAVKADGKPAAVKARKPARAATTPAR